MTDAATKTGAVHNDVVWHETHVTREQRQEIDADNLPYHCADGSRVFSYIVLEMICLPCQ